MPPKRFGGRLRALALASAGQFVVIAAVALLLSVREDNYGVGYGGGLAALGLLCMLVFAPLVLPLLGLLHSLVLMWPASVLARRVRGHDLLWAVGLSLVLGAGYVSLIGWEWWWISVSGALPLLGAAYAEKRQLSRGEMAGRTAAATGIAFALVLALGVVATVTGLIKEYQPPTLAAAEYQGTWQGEHGAELVLAANGEATVRNLPYEGEGFELAVCDGPASWRFESADRSYRDRAVIDHSTCGPMAWQITGTAAHPALFVLIGDPDSGDLHILRKQPQ